MMTQVAFTPCASQALKATAITPMTSATSSALEHLNQKLDDQLHKSLLLEQDLAAAKQREVRLTRVQTSPAHKAHGSTYPCHRLPPPGQAAFTLLNPPP